MTVEEEIVKIQNDLGIKSEIMAKAINITTVTYKIKKSSKNLRDSFNEKKLLKLKQFLKDYISKLWL